MNFGFKVILDWPLRTDYRRHGCEYCPDLASRGYNCVRDYRNAVEQKVRNTYKTTIFNPADKYATAYRLLKDFVVESSTRIRGYNDIGGCRTGLSLGRCLELCSGLHNCVTVDYSPTGSCCPSTKGPSHSQQCNGWDMYIVKSKLPAWDGLLLLHNLQYWLTRLK